MAGDVSLMGEHRLNPPASCHPHPSTGRPSFSNWSRRAALRLFRLPRVHSFRRRGSGPGLPLSFTPTEGLTAKETPPGSSAGSQSTCGNTTSNEATVATPTLGRLCIDPTMNPTAGCRGIKKFLLGLNHPALPPPSPPTPLPLPLAPGSGSGL